MKEIIRKVYRDVEKKEIDLFRTTNNCFYKEVHPELRYKIYNTFDESNTAGHFGDVCLFLREYDYECVR